MLIPREYVYQFQETDRLDTLPFRQRLFTPTKEAFTGEISRWLRTQLKVIRDDSISEWYQILALVRDAFKKHLLHIYPPPCELCSTEETRNTECVTYSRTPARGETRNRKFHDASIETEIMTWFFKVPGGDIHMEVPRWKILHFSLPSSKWMIVWNNNEIKLLVWVELFLNIGFVAPISDSPCFILNNSNLQVKFEWYTESDRRLTATQVGTADNRQPEDKCSVYVKPKVHSNALHQC